MPHPIEVRRAIVLVRPLWAVVRSRRPSWRPLAMAVAVLATAVAASALLLGRVEVVGSSMAPALAEGDRLLVLRLPRRARRWPAPGTVVAVRDPRAPARVLVKRVASRDRRTGRAEVVGDRSSASTDSRTFGPVGADLLVGPVLYRYAPPGRAGRVSRRTAGYARR